MHRKAPSLQPEKYGMTILTDQRIVILVVFRLYRMPGVTNQSRLIFLMVLHCCSDVPLWVDHSHDAFSLTLLYEPLMSITSLP